MARTTRCLQAVLNTRWYKQTIWLELLDVNKLTTNYMARTKDVNKQITSYMARTTRC